MFGREEVHRKLEIRTLGKIVLRGEFYHIYVEDLCRMFTVKGNLPLGGPESVPESGHEAVRDFDFKLWFFCLTVRVATPALRIPRLFSG